jgi:CDP-glucose 4,6-dehydratase
MKQQQTTNNEQPFANVYAGKRVLVTGHTGFKGSWLCEWLLALGAEVTGLALEPATQPALFDQLDLASRMRHVVGDIRDLGTVIRVIEETRPEFVFHLAAQPLVRLSYDIPVETYATNVMGTVHVMEALRHWTTQQRTTNNEQPTTNNQQPPRSCVAVMITTDKCYENREWVHSYREEDPMGGYDPYSSSKGAAEIAIGAYRRSYFSKSDSPVRLASARAGNVIGGGDWALDRIVPDCIRALERGDAIPVRNKVATRPWQHVLEPLGGYLTLAAALATSHEEQRTKNEERGTNNEQRTTNNQQLTTAPLCGAFNFGPNLTSNRTVAELVREVLKHWPGEWVDRSDPDAVHEAKLLNLATDKAFHFLGWQPVWNFEETIAETIGWYRDARLLTTPADFQTLTCRQIAGYTTAARSKGIVWAN